MDIWIIRYGFVCLGMLKNNPRKVLTRNEAVGMMHKNTSDALRAIATAVKKWEYNPDEIIDYLIEIADEMEAQSLVVSMRDELGFKAPNV